MIIGVGVDIVDNRRIQKTLKIYGNKFKKKCFSNNEILRSEKKNNTINSFSKRYAAKEACAKALGTGVARGIHWKDIEVINNAYGKPEIKLYNKALNILNELTEKECNILISLSDEKNYSIANVIIIEK